MLRIRLLLVLALLTPAGAVRAQTVSAAEGLGPAVDAYVAPLRALDVFSGVVLVARGDSVLFRKAYGMAEREHGVALTPSSVFRIASVAKSFTRALAGRLAERGELDLDAPIQRWLPNFPGADRITVRLMLDHRAGVPNVNSLPYDQEAIAPNTLAELVDSLARMPLDFEPGSTRRYSNGGYAVATRILAGGKIVPAPLALDDGHVRAVRRTDSARTTAPPTLPRHHLSGAAAPGREAVSRGRSASSRRFLQPA